MADNTVKTYDFKDYAFIFGAVLLTGFDEGGVSITQVDDTFSDKSGADSTIERTNMGNTQAEITIELLFTNPKNAQLMALFEADVRTNIGALPFTAKDLKGDTTFFTSYAWITKKPDLNMAKETEPVSWTLKTGNTVGGAGGKSTVSSIFGGLTS